MKQSVIKTLFNSRVFYICLHLYTFFLIYAFDNTINEKINQFDIFYTFIYPLLILISFILFWNCGKNPGYAPIQPKNDIEASQNNTDKSSELFNGNHVSEIELNLINQQNQEKQDYNKSFENSDAQSIISNKIYQSSKINQNYQLLKQNLPSLFFCEKCNRYQPFRSKHCDECERCICKYDHHCFWIGGCVGELNHRLFWLFLYFQFIVIYLTLNNFLDSINQYLIVDENGNEIYLLEYHLFGFLWYFIFIPYISYSYKLNNMGKQQKTINYVSQNIPKRVLSVQ
ncbi:hypothetical protein IMG5_150600 [Ichthyophthirius multifiliis]|uniref:Palmitoyltransferase n=1 Tax=Ichthyophthirius multifiliis TaxID=5932 RepID=G0QYL7_ICHMU|nr:hypothetical protein IMG5_150600 [Ichthyophthirius multifiliis]EGR29691.1 hypothetical protein IMG5_150600 [Ichthyophthirius multifiliis]|eukprot:XP_004030927.1 hypothetical protein IMG5_150600 [Ichthyophthirius multifiliis]